MEIRFEIPQLIRANSPRPITMCVRSREILESKQGLTDVNNIKQLPYDTFSKRDPMGNTGFRGSHQPEN